MDVTALGKIQLVDILIPVILSISVYDDCFVAESQWTFKLIFWSQSVGFT